MRVTARAALRVYACVFMFRLCYGRVTACEWSPCVRRKIGIGEIGIGEKRDLAPRTLLALLPAHLIALSSKDNIRHAPHGGRVRGRVISDIAFLLRTYL